MRLTDEAILRESRGKLILLVFNNKGTRAMEVNESFAFLWNKFSGTDFTTEDLASALVEEYGIDPESASVDATSTITIWKDSLLLKEG